MTYRKSRKKNVHLFGLVCGAKVEVDLSEVFRPYWGNRSDGVAVLRIKDSGGELDKHPKSTPNQAWERDWPRDKPALILPISIGVLDDLEKMIPKVRKLIEEK